MPDLTNSLNLLAKHQSAAKRAERRHEQEYTHDTHLAAQPAQERCYGRPAYTPKHYRFWQMDGYTMIRPDDGSAAQMTWKGTSADEIAAQMTCLENQIRRHERNLHALRTVLQTISPESVTYISVDTAVLDPAAA